MVLYALISDTSIGYLFLGGVIPGLLLGARPHGDEHRSWRAAATSRSRRRSRCARCPRITLGALPALMMPVILLGGIYGGVMTPTEARRRRRRLRVARLGRALSRSDAGSSSTTRCSSAREATDVDRHADRRRARLQLRGDGREYPELARAPAAAATISSPAASCSWSTSSCWCSAACSRARTILLVIVPIFIPTAKALGIDLVHFGVVVVVNIMIGLITPPYGLLLFVIANMSGAAARRDRPRRRCRSSSR